MMPIRKIMWPTDLESPSLTALDAACELAAHFSSNLVVFHAIERDSAANPAGDVRPLAGMGKSVILAERARKRIKEDMLNTFKRMIRTRVTNGITVLPIVTQGKAADEIIRIARAEKVDLIVMGASSRAGLWRWLSRSVGDEVLRRAPCPVLSVKPKTQDG